MAGTTSQYEKRREHAKRAERKGLVLTWPNCGFLCPEGNPFSCGCEKCGQKEGFFNNRTNEKNWILADPKLSSREKAEGKRQYVKYWDNRKGYLGSRGCRLDPKYRSIVCLKEVCRRR